MFLAKIKDFYSHHKKAILLSLFVGFFMFSIGDTAFALDDKAEPSDGIKAINFFLTIVSTLLGTLSGLISLLLNPGWVNGTIFGFETYLKDIWILVSNIVYFIFAFLLITIAFMNIIGKGDNKWELKQALPKFVIGVLIVPFSWFFVQFVLSLTAFLTVSILSLPYDTLNGKAAFTEYENVDVCNTYVLDLSASTASGGTNSNEGCTAFKGKKDSIKNILKGETTEGVAGSVFGIINIYTYAIMKVDQTPNLFQEQIKEGVKDLSGLAIKVIFDLIFIVVFLILMVALFLALFARGTWLWIHAMFSPVYGLMYFFGSEGNKDTQKIGVKEFLSLAMIPVYVSAALAFGLIFMFVAAHGLSQKQANNSEAIFTMVDKAGEPVTPKADGKYKEGTFPVLNVGGFRLVVKGAHGAKIGGGLNSVMSSFGGGLGQLILELFGLAILWIALMAALKGSKITAAVTAPIDQFGKSVGSLIAKSPQYAPIIPTGKGMASANSLQSFGANVASHYDAKSKNFGTELSSQMFGKDPALAQAINKLESTLGQAKDHKDPALKKAMKDVFAHNKTSEDLVKDPRFMSSYGSYGDLVLKNTGSTQNDQDQFKKLMKSNNPDDLSRAVGLVEYFADKKGSSSEHGVLEGKQDKNYMNRDRTDLDSRVVSSPSKSTEGTTAKVDVSGNNTVAKAKSTSTDSDAKDKDKGNDTKKDTDEKTTEPEAPSDE